MFAVLFEAKPTAERAKDYLEFIKRESQEMALLPAFDVQVRYKSLGREDWFLSESQWRDEKAAQHWFHKVADEGVLNHHFEDAYRIRIGGLSWPVPRPGEPKDVPMPVGEPDLDPGEVVTLVTATRPDRWDRTNSAYDCAQWMGLDPVAAGLLSWDVLEDVEVPGNLVLLANWKCGADAAAFIATCPPNFPWHSRMRQVRIIEDRQG